MKAHKNKIRATFYIDKKLYQLLKRCSQVEEIPMSSIINEDILKPRVGKYEVSTPEEVGDYEYIMNVEAEEHENEKLYELYDSSLEGKRNSKISAINAFLKSKRISADKAKKQKLQAEEKYQEDLKKENKEEERSKKEHHEKWLKAVADFPIE